MNPIKSFQWNPSHFLLAVSSGSQNIFFWNPEGASVCDLPFEGKNFNIQTLEWSKDGKSILMVDKVIKQLNSQNDVVLGYPQNELLNQNDDYLE